MLYVHAGRTWLELHLSADQNVLSVQNAHSSRHVSTSSALILVLEPVVLELDAKLSTTTLFAHAHLVKLEIHSDSVIPFLLKLSGLLILSTHADHRPVVLIQSVGIVEEVLPVLVCQTLWVHHPAAVQNVPSILNAHHHRPVSTTNVLTPVPDPVVRMLSVPLSTTHQSVRVYPVIKVTHLLAAYLNLGLFRLTCEKVLEVMQKEKETLLTLLEAFVYDPLIDWTPMHEAGYTGAVYGGGRAVGQEIKQSRRQLEREVTLAMYSVLVVEISHEWNANKTKVENELREFVNLINNWLETNKNLAGVMTQLQERHSQMAYLKEAEGQPKHALFSLGKRFEKYRNTFGIKHQVTTSLENIVKESDILLSHYQRAVDMLRVGKVAKWRMQVTTRPTQDICTVFDLIKEFLQNAGKNNTVNQCVESESAVSRLCAEVSEVTLNVTDLLLSYWEIAENYPPSFVMAHRSRLFKQWALMLLEDMSIACCSRIGYDMSTSLTVTEDEVILRSQYYSDLVLLCSSPPAVPVLPQVEPFDPSSLTNLPRKALAAAVVVEIIDVSTSILRLESAAVGNAGSGEVLASLMTPQGTDQWFLENAVALTGALRELVCLVPSEKDSPLYSAARTIGIIHSKYKALQMLDDNVRSIIVNEAVRLAKGEEPSVLTVHHLLETVMAPAGAPPRNLVEVLTSALTNALNGSELTDVEEAAVTTVETLEVEVNKLLAALEYKSALTSGEMLLLGFSGLFAPLVPPQGPPDIPAPPSLPKLWTTTDVAIDSTTYAVRLASACEEGTIWHLVRLLAAASRVTAISETLALCRAEAGAWATACHPPFDPSHLAAPAQTFISQSVRLRLAGMAATAAISAVAAIIEEYCLLPGEPKVNPNNNGRLIMEDISHQVISSVDDCLQARETVHKMTAAVQYQLALEHRQQEAVAAAASRERMAIARTTYYWLYEPYLLAGPEPAFNRGDWSIEVGKALGGLYSVQTRMKEALSQQEALVTTVGQRLRWAAGANPALNEVLSAFEESVRLFREKVEQEMALAAEAASLANCIVLYEGLCGQTKDTVAADSSFAVLLKDCHNAYNAGWADRVSLTPLEESIAALCPPPTTVTPEWTAAAENKISELIQRITEEVDPLQISLFAAEDCIKTKAMVIRFEMSKRNRIVSDIRQLFKTMVKFEDAGEMGLESYLEQYKEYSDRMSKITKRFTLPEAFGEAQMMQVLTDAEILIAQTEDVYDNLLKFSFKETYKEQHLTTDGGKKKTKKLVHTKSVQEKNSYAVSVWRRIKMKLEGRDPDPGVRSSVHHQVRWAVDEAVSVDNLATLYEGWTPWV